MFDLVPKEVFSQGRIAVQEDAVTASFVYDGDGNRVSQTVNGVTTYFVGAHYELTGSTVTKYYFAGAQRIAMRKYTVPFSMAVEYFLGDHLGSTSITTDSNGAKVSEMRYKPWGEVRYSWTAGGSTTPAYLLPNYTFTSQYSHMDDPSTTGVTEGFGLLFYASRMYDSALGRFTQADSIVPGGSQGLDRYAYTLNNPVRYTDPSGHIISCEADENCKEVRRTDRLSFDDAYNEAFASYGVSVGSGFSRNHKTALLQGVLLVGQRLAAERGVGESGTAAFTAVFKDGVNFVFDSQCRGCRSDTTNERCGNNFAGDCAAGGGLTSWDGLTITFASMTGQSSNAISRMTKNVVHELGHSFYHYVGNPMLGSDFSRDALRPNEYDGRWDWQQHPPSMNVDGLETPGGGELFADTFLAWTYGAWNSLTANEAAVAAAQNAMNGYVPR